MQREKQKRVDQILGFGKKKKIISDLAAKDRETPILSMKAEEIPNLEMTPEKAFLLFQEDPQMGMFAASILSSQEKQSEATRKYEQERAAPFLKQADQERQLLPQRKLNIQQMKSSAGDVGYFSKSNLATMNLQAYRLLFDRRTKSYENIHFPGSIKFSLHM